MSYFRDIHGSSDSCPSGCVECKLLSRIEFLSRLGTQVRFPRQPHGQTFRIWISGLISGGETTVRTPRGYWTQSARGLSGWGFLWCSLASIANGMYGGTGSHQCTRRQSPARTRSDGCMIFRGSCRTKVLTKFADSISNTGDF